MDHKSIIAAPADGKTPSEGSGETENRLSAFDRDTAPKLDQRQARSTERMSFACIAPESFPWGCSLRMHAHGTCWTRRCAVRIAKDMRNKKVPYGQENTSMATA